MSWYYILFPLAMILFPAVFMSFVRANPNAEIDPGRAWRITVGLWLATAGAVAVWLLAYAFISPWVASFGGLLSFPLFFGFWFPLMRAKNPDWVSTPPPDLPTRGASLTPRLAQPVAPAWALWSVWLLWGACLAVILALIDWTVLASTEEAVASRRLQGWFALLAGVSIVLVPLVIRFVLRRDREEPQPLDPAGSAELIDLYARRRRQRAWLFIGLGWALILCNAVIITGVALSSRGTWPEADMGRIFAWAGAVMGTLIGLGGAVFGTMSSIQAARINAKLRERTQA